MLLIKPMTITPSMVTASNAGDADPVYSPTTSYTLGQRVFVPDTGRAYQCVQAPALGQPPASSPLHWIEAGPSNRWAMFDGEVGTATKTTNLLTTTLVVPTRIEAMSFVGLKGGALTVTITSVGGEVVTLTKVLRRNPASWYDYYYGDREQITGAIFTGLPPFAGATISISLSGGACEIGVVSMGSSYDLGETQMGVQTSIIDYSRKVTSADGVQSLKQGRYSKRMSAQLLQTRAQYSRVTALLESVRATPCIWVAAPDEPELDPTTIFGFYRDFSIELSYPTYHVCSLEIEGMT